MQRFGQPLPRGESKNVESNVYIEIDVSIMGHAVGVLLWTKTMDV